MVPDRHIRRTRDLVIIGLGAGVVIVQLVLEFTGRSASEAFLNAGFGAIAGVPFLHRGDHDTDKDKHRTGVDA